MHDCAPFDIPEQRGSGFPDLLTDASHCDETPDVTNTPDRSCVLCGFFVPRPTLAGNLGYCLNNEDEDPCRMGECFKIPEGEEANAALRCQDYFRTVQGLSRGEFLAWRSSQQMFQIQQEAARHTEQIARRLNILGLAIAGAGLLIALAQLGAGLLSH